MPAKHTIKLYVADGVYHIYNRGVEKRVIFEDDDDYRVFLHCLKQALLSPDKLPKLQQRFPVQGVSLHGVARPPKNFYGEIELAAYCLMPNHFHLMIKQKNDRTMDSFMRSIATRYSIYFNKKYNRVGSLFQGTYKAVNVDDDTYLLHLSRYIHRNPLKYTKNLIDAYSSYADYVGKRNTEWLKTGIVLDFFQPTKLPFLRHINSYRSFVEYEREKDGLLSGFTLGFDDY